jgi:hypothetical protein
MSTTASLLAQVVADVAATDALYLSLFRPNIDTHPLLYWGNPATARFATFGVNPSAAEFTKNRWPNSSLTVAELDARSVNYFNNPTVPPHPWFDGYETALNILGHSYKKQNHGDTVHLDLSPRATKAMSTVDRITFLKMVAADLRWFLSALTLCTQVKAAIMSGSVTGAHYFDEFLCKYLPMGYSLKLNIAFGVGRAATALYTFSGPGFAIPVFFCRKSPSGDKGELLAGEIYRNLPQLKAAGL